MRSQVKNIYGSSRCVRISDLSPAVHRSVIAVVPVLVCWYLQLQGALSLREYARSTLLKNAASVKRVGFFYNGLRLGD